MQLAHFPKEFDQALPILQQIEANGYEAYFVGGSVRDSLLQRPISDVDIATSAFPAEIKAIFPYTIDTGIQHGTVTVRQDQVSYEVTTFRTESGYQDFRRPDQVTFVRQLSDDLKRRDFTINALAVRADGRIIDQFGGLDDLNKHLIRAVGDAKERFHEDALRMMRAVRFSGQLGFRVVASTALSLQSQAPLLTKIAVERIHSELIKLMLSPYWYLGWNQFVDSGLICYTPFFSQYEINAIPHFTANESEIALSDETAVWVFLAEAFIIEETELPVLLHEWKSANQVKHDSDQALHFSRYLRQHQTLMPAELYRINPITIDRVATIWTNLGWQCDWPAVRQAYDDLPIHHRNELWLDGQKLIQLFKMKPGRKVGLILDQAEQAVINGKVENSEIGLSVWLKKRLQI